MSLKYFGTGDFDSAKYYNITVIPLVAISGDNIRMREVNTNLAFCLVRCAKTISKDVIKMAVQKLQASFLMCELKNEVTIV